MEHTSTNSPSQEPDRAEQDSLAPVDLDRLTLDEEVASMSRGKGRQLLSIAALVGMLAVGGGSLMRTLDHQQAEKERSTAVAALGGDHVEAYLRCVLPGTSPSAFGSSERLLAALESVIERQQKPYAVTLERCEQELDGLVQALVTADVRSDLESLRVALEQDAKAVSSAALGLRVYLQDGSRDYDYVKALARIDRLAHASARYHAADAAYRAQLVTR